MYVTNICTSEGGMLTFNSFVILSNAMSLSRFECNIRIQTLFYIRKKLASLEVKPMNISRISFGSVFKLLKEEFDTHSEDDGEAVLETLNREKEVEEKTTDNLSQTSFKRKYTDTESNNDECEQFDELK